jgi:tetratricopeptide (TPR) repeat protein
VSEKPVRVSLCMIVRNEQANLEKCLAPVAELFDEMVIVDTGSVDATREIARRYTPHVYDFRWCDDFSAARNESLRRANGEWIFWLDADDRVRPAQVERLRGIIEQLDERPRVVMMDTLLLPSKPQEDLQCVTHPRLFRAHDGLRWRGRVHEQILPDLVALGHELIFTEVQIEHVGYTDQALCVRKARRKLRLLQMDYAVNPKDPSTLLHLGMAFSSTGNTANAQACLSQAIESDQPAGPCSRCAYQGLASLFLSTGDPRAALDCSARGLSQFPSDGQLLYSRAIAFYVLNDLSAAASVLEQLISSRETRTSHFTSIADLRTKLAPRLLGAVRRLQGRFSEAEAILLAVLREFPADAKALYLLGLVYVRLRRSESVQSIVDKLQQTPGGQVDAGVLDALWHLRNGHPALAGPRIENLIAMEPDDSRPRILQVEWLSRVKAPPDELLKALRDVVRIEPGNFQAHCWIEKLTKAKLAAVQPAAPPYVATAGMMPVPVTGHPQ